MKNEDGKDMLVAVSFEPCSKVGFLRYSAAYRRATWRLGISQQD